MKIGDWFDKGLSENYVYIIAEIGQTHEGSLGLAHSFIDAVATTGVDAIKYQTHIAEAESTPYEPFRVKFSYEDKTRYDYWKRMEFKTEEWKELYSHAKNKNLDFMSSAFSIEAFRLLQELGIPAWKISSGEVFNEPLVKKMVATGKPIILSTGMSTFEDIDKQIKMIDLNKYAIMQCTTEYPCPAENVGLNVVTEMLNRYNCPIGLSDHSGYIYPSLAAVTKGALLLEVHVTLSEYMFGPDVKSSLTISKLKEMVEGVRYTSMMLNSFKDKNIETSDMKNLKKIFTRGIYAGYDLDVGHIISADDIQLKKPVSDIEGNSYKDILGNRITKKIRKGEPLTWDAIEGIL